MIRVAIPLFGGSQWTGGRNYLINLCRVVSTRLSDSISLAIIGDSSVTGHDLEDFQGLSGVEVVSMGDYRWPNWGGLSPLNLLRANDAQLYECFKDNQVDALLETTTFHGRKPGVPAMTWIPDLQHRLFPEMFSIPQGIARDIRLRAQLTFGRRIMVSSHAAAEDVGRFYPPAKGRINVVRFAIPPAQFDDEQIDVCQLYNLPEKFLFVPNQFWRHKNHLRLISALRRLVELDSDVVLVATGNPDDVRFPGYFDSVTELVTQLELESNYRYLGLVPYPHVGALMRRSLALVNPSLCEGWSTTVEEAKSNGTPLVLSSISVHREQAGEDAVYFNPLSEIDIARALGLVWKEGTEQARRFGSPGSNHEATENRVSRFAQEFKTAIETLIAV